MKKHYNSNIYFNVQCPVGEPGSFLEQLKLLYNWVDAKTVGVISGVFTINILKHLLLLTMDRPTVKIYLSMPATVISLPDKSTRIIITPNADGKLTCETLDGSFLLPYDGSLLALGTHVCLRITQASSAVDMLKVDRPSRVGLGLSVPNPLSGQEEEVGNSAISAAASSG